MNVNQVGKGYRDLKIEGKNNNNNKRVSVRKATSES